MLEVGELKEAACIALLIGADNGKTLEKPKSQSFTWQSESMSMLAGLMSR